MNSKPIIFSAPMIQAILAGRKTQTRRVLNRDKLYNGFAFDDHRIARACPYGQPGDQLWVRETWAHPVRGCEFQKGVSYRADHIDPSGDASPIKWRPSIFMPRWASRINLLIKNVRVERLQEISEADAIAEGFEAWAHTGNDGYDDDFGTAKDSFTRLWDHINALRGYSWASNTWVFVIEFEVIKG